MWSNHQRLNYWEFTRLPSTNGEFIYQMVKWSSYETHIEVGVYHPSNLNRPWQWSILREKSSFGFPLMTQSMIVGGRFIRLSHLHELSTVTSWNISFQIAYTLALDLPGNMRYLRSVQPPTNTGDNLCGSTLPHHPRRNSIYGNTFWLNLF